MAAFIAAALGLFASHAVLSAPGVRPALIRSLGRSGFQALHAAVSVIALAVFAWAYAAFDANRMLYAPLPGSGPGAVLLMPIAFLLVAGRLMTPFGELAAPKPPHGIYRITRFPGSTGLLIWAGLHLAATGDLRRVVLFATMAAIALFAILKNDWVLRRADNSEARGFRAATSVVPFAAIIAGRQRLASGEIGWRFPVVALLPYAALLLAHPLLFEVDPLDRLR